MFDYRTFSREQMTLLDDAVNLYLNSRAHATYDYSLNLLADANNGYLAMLHRQTITHPQAVGLARAVVFAALHTRSKAKAQRYFDLQKLMDTTP